jgi:hypothetical protein
MPRAYSKSESDVHQGAQDGGSSGSLDLALSGISIESLALQRQRMQGPRMKTGNTVPQCILRWLEESFLKAKSDVSIQELQSVEQDRQLPYPADESQEFLEQGQQEVLQDFLQDQQVRKIAGHGQQDQTNEQEQGDDQLLHNRTEARRNRKSSRASRRNKKDERLKKTNNVNAASEALPEGNGDDDDELGFEAFKYGLRLLARNHPESQDLHG